MKDVLEEIVAWKRIEVAEAKAQTPFRQLEQDVLRLIDSETAPPPSMSRALQESQTGIIAEFKRRSPSKGWINEEAQVADVTHAYQQGGAATVSILTDEKFFGGHDVFVTQTRQAGLTLPVLYKNFVIDEYQLFQARCCGASAALLIAACLRKDQCRRLLRLAHDLSLEVLLETHSEAELEYVELEPEMCGVNNRNLGTFVTDVDNSFRMAQRLPADICKVSESGISDPATVLRLRQAGYRGFLIGETFMKTGAPGEALSALIHSLTQDLETQKTQ